MPQDLPIALITGGSRGVGAAVAKLLAEKGYHVVINYRDKVKRAHEVAAKIRQAGGVATTFGADITDPQDIEEMFCTLEAAHRRLDLLVLNASGGLEIGKSVNYPMELNRDAQVRLAKRAMDLMMPRCAGRIVFITSHQAHYFGTEDEVAMVDQYRPVAASKKAGEEELRNMVPAMTNQGVSFAVVSGDIIEDTVTATLLERKNRGMLAARKEELGKLLTVDEFAAAIVRVALDSSIVMQIVDPPKRS